MGKLGASADRQYAAIRNIRVIWEDFKHGPGHVRDFDTIEEARAYVRKSKLFDWAIVGIQFGAVKVIAYKRGR